MQNAYRARWPLIFTLHSSLLHTLSHFLFFPPQNAAPVILLLLWVLVLFVTVFTYIFVCLFVDLAMLVVAVAMLVVACGSLKVFNNHYLVVRCDGT